MRRFTTLLVMALVGATPAQAADWNSNDRIGTFAGARIKLSLGGSAERKVKTALAFSPMRVRQTAGGGSTAIGRGLELGFSGHQAELTVAGLRADQALRLATGKQAQLDQKSGLSKGAWVGIAAGVVVVGAVIFVATMTCVGRDRDYCGSD